MNVGAQALVVGQVPARRVGVFIDHDVVAVPVPAIHVAKVVGRDTKEKAAETEAVGVSAVEMPHMAGAEAASETAVLPGMVEVEVSILAAGVVADPLAVLVYVWGVGMALAVGEIAVGLGMRLPVIWSGSAFGRVSRLDSIIPLVAAAMLSARPL